MRAVTRAGAARTMGRMVLVAAAGLGLLGCSGPTPRGPGITSPTRIAGPGSVALPQWSPDGQAIAYIAEQTQEVEPDGHGAVEKWILRRLGPQSWTTSLDLCVSRVRTGASSCLAEVPVPHYAWLQDGTAPAFLTSQRMDSHTYLLELSMVPGVKGTNRRMAAARLSSASSPLLPWNGSPLAFEPPQGTRVAVFGTTPKGNSGVGVLDVSAMKLTLLAAFGTPQDREVWLQGGISWGADGRVYVTLRKDDPSAGAGRCVLGGRVYRYEVWSVDTKDLSIRQETAGPSDCSPSMDPSGHRLSFIRRGSVLMRRPDGSLVTLISAGSQGRTHGSASWSPDGRHIAFAWDEGPKGIGIWRAIVREP